MSRIQHIRVMCVGPKLERYSWSHDLPQQFMTNLLVRIRTDDGFEGGAVWNATSFDFDLQASLRVGRELEDLGFRWFEAPLPDHDLGGYRELTRQLRIPVLPSGNWVQDLPAFAEAIRTRAWGAARTDPTMMGGITGARNAAVLAAAAGLDCELMA